MSQLKCYSPIPLLYIVNYFLTFCWKVNQSPTMHILRVASLYPVVRICCCRAYCVFHGPGASAGLLASRASHAQPLNGRGAQSTSYLFRHDAAGARCGALLKRY